MSTVLVCVSVGLAPSNWINFVETYELPDPESMSALHLIPFTSTTTTGNIPSFLSFDDEVMATFFPFGNLTSVSESCRDE